jgi:Fe2+ or Zn2+ uptake regulation protein
VTDIIGYRPAGDGYEPIYRNQPGSIVTHAFIICADCGKAISSSGGPAHGSLHVSCYENRKLKTFVQGGKNA